MDVTFGEGFTRQEQAELEAVLQRIEAGEAPGCWRERPDTIHVRGRLTDGRSGCAVLDVVVRTGSREPPMVAKVGPFHELKDEWKAFNDHLRDASALFAPILAVTPALLGTRAPDGEREAVVYDHAARFAGLPGRPPVTLEGFVRCSRRAPRRLGSEAEWTNLPELPGFEQDRVDRQGSWRRHRGSGERLRER